MASIENMTDEELLAMTMPGERGYVVPALRDPLLQKRTDVIDEDIDPDDILSKSMDAEPVYKIGEPDIEDGFVDRVSRGAERVGRGVGDLVYQAHAAKTKALMDPAGAAEEAKQFASRVMEGDPEAQEQALIATSMSMVEPMATGADIELARRDVRKAMETREPGDIATAGISTVFAAIPIVGVGLTKGITKAASATSKGESYFEPERLSHLKDLVKGYGERESLIYMSPDEFLSLAKPLSEPTANKAERVAGILERGEKFSEVPFLEMKESGKIRSHEGRHRAMALKKLGVEKMPVRLRSNDVRWNEQVPGGDDDGYYVENLPKHLIGQDGKTKIKSPFHTEGPNRGKPLPEYSADVTKPSTAGPEPVFESVLEKAVVEKMPNKTSVDAVISTLRSGGATKSEIADTKVPEFVEQAKAEGKKSVTKDEVIQHLDENKVQIEEVRLGKSLQKLPKEIEDLSDQRFVAFESLNQEATDLARVLAPNESASAQVDKLLDNPNHFDRLYVDYVGGFSTVDILYDVPDDMVEIVERLRTLSDNRSISNWRPEDAALITEARNVINAKLADPEYKKFVDQQQADFSPGGWGLLEQDNKGLLQHNNLEDIGRVLNEMPEAETRLAALRQFQASPKYQEYSRLSKDFREKYSSFFNNLRKLTPVYERYSVPHGDNYQEILLTVPDFSRKIDDLKFTNNDLQTALDSMDDAYEPGTMPDLEMKRAVEIEKQIEANQKQIDVFSKKATKPFTDSHHKDIPNVMVHIRTKDRFDHKGRKILFVEEIQSDWHQKGRKEGYESQRKPTYYEVTQPGVETQRFENIKDAEDYTRQARKKESEIRERVIEEGEWYLPDETSVFMEKIEDKRILPPDAPLKDTKEWTALAVRRVFREAADKGYDGVAFSRADMITPVVTLPGDQAFEALGDRREFIYILGEMRKRGSQYAEAADEAERVFKGNEYYYDKLLPSIAQKQSFVPPKRLPKETSEDYKVRLDQAKKAHRSTTLIELKDVGFSKVKERQTPGMSYPQFNKQVERLAESGWVQEVPFFELTPKVKEKVSKPQKLYSLALPAVAVGAAAAEEEELSAAAALGAIGMGGMALYKGARGARAAGRATDVATAGAKTVDEAEEAARMWREMGTESPYFKKKFGNTKVVDDAGEALPVFHGTSGDFDEFRPGSPNSAFGSAIYTSNSVNDVNINYARAEGPDIKNRVVREIERIQDLDEVPDQEVLDAAKRYIDEVGYASLPFLEKAIKEQDVSYILDATGEVAGSVENILIDTIARKRVLGDGNFSVMKTYVNIENPVYLDPSGNKGRTTFNLDIEYDDEGNFVGESGSVIELLETIDDVADNFETSPANARNLKQFISQEAIDGEVDAFDIFKEVKDGNYYFETEMGEAANSEFIRQVFENMGFDGIVADAHYFFGPRDGSRGFQKLGMEGVTPGTYHYMAFKPEQIKSATGNVGTFDPTDPSILKGIGVGAAGGAAARAMREDEVQDDQEG